MEHRQAEAELNAYADATKSRILSSQSDLESQDVAMPEMLAWSRRHKTIVVLRSGKILTSQPSSRVVQNCRIVMQEKQLKIKDVYPATQALIQFLLENTGIGETNAVPDRVDVSEQQQRLRLLVKAAIDVEASDIHIEVRKEIARIRMRKHGELFLHAEWLPKLAREVISVAFNKETDHAVVHFNPLVPMSASMLLRIDNISVRLRIASLPAHEGYDVVMRLLTTRDEQIRSLKALGYFPDQIAMFEKALALPQGTVIVSGPTGSGKTTTLASCMQTVDARRKVYTIEDPVEKLVSHTTQVPVNTQHYDRDFASMARTVLRMDPDVVVLGEMRDEETAKIMLRAAITGHLVFSTVHTHSATSIVTRLMDLGISETLLATPDVLTCLVCQRLVPVLCKKCCVSLTDSRRHYKEIDRWQRVFGDRLRLVRARGVRCTDCHNLGIQGRTVVAEMIWIDEWSRRLILNNNIFGWRQYLKQNGWKSYADRMIDLVGMGRIDPLDAEKIIGPLDKQTVSARFDYRGKKS